MAYSYELRALKTEDLVAELDRRKKEQARLESLPRSRRLAEFLHGHLCHYDHTDGCSWDYESWEKPGNERTRWEKKALRLLDITDEATIVKIVKLL